MQKQIISLACLILFISACIKETSTYSTTIAINSTTHKIKLIPFSQGTQNSVYSFELFQHSEREIYSYENGGKGKGATYGSLLQFNDSIKVIFDDTISMTHYKPKPIGTNLKSYPYKSKRNFFNDSSYIGIISSETSGTRNWSFTYTFTEQDYLDAK